MIKIFLVYSLVGMLIAYTTKQQLDNVRLMLIKADVKTRNKINQRKKQIKSNLKLSPVWPLLLIREVYDEFKIHRQG
jgi:hypothetical protein